MTTTRRWSPALLALGSGALGAWPLLFRYDQTAGGGAGGSATHAVASSSSKAASASTSGAGGDSCVGKNDKCGTLCVDLKADNEHCLVCDVKCNPDRICIDGNCLYPPSCQALHKSRPTYKSGVYTIDPSSFDPYKDYCDMDGDGGGWTLLMKVSAASNGLFSYSGSWGSQFAVNATSPDLDQTEAKLQSAHDMPLTELRVGMMVNATTRWLVIGFPSTSLSDLFKTNALVHTMADQTKWATLLPQPYTYSGCIVEGLNVPNTVRLGVGMRSTVTVNCEPFEAVIGFGIGPGWGASGIHAGNADNTQQKETPAFGYIMAR